MVGAGVAEVTNQLDYDDEVAHHAVQKLHDLGRADDGRPWMLTVSFTHPHDPYVARARFWDLYADCEHLAPRVPDLGYAAQDPHSRRIFDANDWRSFEIGEEHVRRARRGYFANISYIDAKIGEVLAALAAMRMAEDTIVLFTSDHGDMLGERGLWFKMSFFEGSARVPLMIAAPGFAAGRVATPVSTLDVTPTLAELAGIDLGEVAPWTDGESLVPLMRGGDGHGPVRMEYAAEASVAPLVALRRGRWKLVLCAADPPLLFDLEADPDERVNLAPDPAQAATLARLTAEAEGYWDLAAYDAEVRQSQARRHLVYAALRNGAYFPWDYQPLLKASERYMRNHMDLNAVDASRRFPRDGALEVGADREHDAAGVVVRVVVAQVDGADVAEAARHADVEGHLVALAPAPRCRSRCRRCRRPPRPRRRSRRIRPASRSCRARDPSRPRRRPR